MKKFGIIRIFIVVSMVLSVGLGVVFPTEEQRTREEQKVAAWINQLGDKDPKVREDAALSLEDFSDRNVMLTIPVNKTQVKKLLQALDGLDPKVKVGALAFLSRLGGRDIVEKVKLKLKDEDAEVRTRAAAALIWLRPLGNIGPLITAAEDENYWVRCVVAEALGLSKYPEAYQVLVRLYQDERDEVRRSVVSALGDYGDKRTEPLFIAALNDPNPKIRWGAAYALGHIGEKESISPLIEMLRQEDENGGFTLHETVNLALFQITLQNGLEGYEPWNNWWKENKDTFDPVERVRERLQSESHISVSFALRRIKSHRMEELKPELHSMLGEKDNIKLEPWVSALSLAEWGDLDGLAYFFWALKKEPRVMEELRKFTGQFFYGDPQAWLKWWEENKSRIRWNEKHHIFEVVEEESG